MFENLANGDQLLKGYEQVEAFFDMEYVDDCVFLEGYKLFPILAQQYPDAVFILNTRNRDAWIRSRLGHQRGRYARIHLDRLGLDSIDDLARIWEADWDSHHKRVRDFFSCSQFRFLEYNIETDPPQELSYALPELTLDPSLYKIANMSKPTPLVRLTSGISSLSWRSTRS